MTSEIQNKIETIARLVGIYSLPGENPHISILNGDGLIDSKKIETVIARHYDKGFTGIVDSSSSYSSMAQEKLVHSINHNALHPFNSKMLTNQKIIAENCKKFGMKYYCTILDNVGIKFYNYLKERRLNSKSSDRDTFNDYDLQSALYRFIQSFIETFATLDNVSYVLCDNPEKVQYNLLAEVFYYLISRKVPPESIILGINPIDYPDFIKFIDEVVDKLGDEEWREKLETESILYLPYADEDRINDLWGHLKEGGSGIHREPEDESRILYSISYKKFARKILAWKQGGRECNKILFEIIIDCDNYEASLNLLTGILKECRAYRKK